MSSKAETISPAVYDEALNIQDNNVENAEPIVVESSTKPVLAPEAEEIIPAVKTETTSDVASDLVSEELPEAKLLAEMAAYLILLGTFNSGFELKIRGSY